MGGWTDGWLANEFLKKTPSPKFGLESLLVTFDFGVCQYSEIATCVMFCEMPVESIIYMTILHFFNILGEDDSEVFYCKNL